MGYYSKRPIVVEAEQFFAWKSIPFAKDHVVKCEAGSKRWYVTTIHHQKAYLDEGDWVIREGGTDDKAYPCKPYIFEATYQVVEDDCGNVPVLRATHHPRRVP